jgi:hypothetical protein
MTTAIDTNDTCCVALELSKTSWVCAFSAPGESTSRRGNFREHLSTLCLEVRRRHYADLMAATRDTSVSIAQRSVAAALAPILRPLIAVLGAHGWPRRLGAIETCPNRVAQA